MKRIEPLLLAFTNWLQNREVDLARTFIFTCRDKSSKREGQKELPVPVLLPKPKPHGSYC